MKIIKKHPSSQENYDFDFTDKLSGGETIAAVVSITASPSGDLTFGTPAISGSHVSVKVSGGGTGKLYVLTCIIGTSNPVEQRVLEGGITVNDPGNYP